MTEQNNVRSRDAMSRALGAAFLNHQVEQLEKTVQNTAWRARSQEGQSGHVGREGIGSASLIGVGMNGIAGSRNRTGAALGAPGFKARRGSSDGAKFYQKIDVGKAREKDADVIVVDASVLIHALYQVKKWCREGREEIIIIPLEALNTLDLLKKGTSQLAQRARAASRILEAQVGTNERIMVQRDDAYVIWDELDLSDGPQSTGEKEEASPEWVRRTICCAKYESNKGSEAAEAAPHVLLAVLHPPPSPAFAGNNGLIPPHFMARSSGTLVAHWAKRAAMGVLEVAPCSAGAGGVGRGQDARENSEDKKAKRYFDGHGHGRGGGKAGAKSLVERPAALMALMDPSRPVVRVLARGEKLDAGT